MLAYKFSTEFLTEEVMENKDKAIELFQYIKELYAIKSKIVTDIKDQIWFQYINEIPDDKENIAFNYFDKTAEDDSELDQTFILRIQKPEFEKCPDLPKELESWIDIGWDSFKFELKKIEKKATVPPSEEYIYFDDDAKRTAVFAQWSKIRKDWAIRQSKLAKTRDFFNRLYFLYIDLEREEENTELMIGQGILHCLTDSGIQINHPILLKRVKIEFDAQENVLTIVDSTADAEIYTMLLDSISYINHSAIKGLKNELAANFYHPLDRNDTPDYLKSFAHRLHADSKYEDNLLAKPTMTEKIVIYNNPVLFVRKRTGGVLKALENIIAQISQGEELSGPILNLLGENVSQITQSAETTKAPSLESELSAISGEDKDILFSKEANKEQLEIARRIENYNAVLVQGPPGTGKTHTIANLMGHFLAQGKNILVTSHTRKALSVVKEKVVPELQSLCVSILDDNNKDMERSVDGITEYISTHNSFDLKEKIKEVEEKRRKILDELDDTRKKLYAIKHKEYETIVFGGKGYSVAEAAQYVLENEETLSYLPGEVTLYQPLPVTTADLALLYETNAKVSIEDEKELNFNLPDPQDLISPQEFGDLLQKNNHLNDRLKFLIEEINNNIEMQDTSNQAVIAGELLCQSYDDNLASKLLDNIKNNPFNDVSPWMAHALLAGKQGGGMLSVWTNLCNEIKETYNFADKIAPIMIGKKVEITTELMNDKALNILAEIEDHLSKGKKLNAMAMLFHKEWKDILAQITVNAKEIASADDAAIAKAYISLRIKRAKIQSLWDELICKNGGISFSAFGEAPELACISFTKQIEWLLNWYNNDFANLKKDFLACGFSSKCIKSSMQFIIPQQETEYLLDLVYRVFPLYIELANITIKFLPEIKAKIQETISLLKKQNEKSIICGQLLLAVENQNSISYEKYYAMLSDLYQKNHYQVQRSRILKQIAQFAPQWAQLIENRVGIHGKDTQPSNIEEAWKWKQFAGIIGEITAQPFEELQHKSVRLNKDLRQITAKLAEYKAWYHLMLRVEDDITQKQALQGWKLTTKKIGKGTGKNAAKHKREAQQLMAKCQTAVPAWIMPINKALESLDPSKNKFDIIIIDEASQSDISALAIFYMAKKIIVVGDDEQVSPSGIGIEIDKMNALLDSHITGIIPNAHLYDMKSSLYDIAKTTFQPLMLKEHFRCVPDIIGYSNRLSYDYKIKPLRDDSNVPTKPATIAYRVAGRREENKTNLAEAENIVALMMACMEQPEYNGMTFGAISLLGNEQAKLINKIALEKISIKEYTERRILCGNASHFQGDERDVIFISLVDNNEGEGPLRTTTEGVGKSTKQRYNVAVSRAKNQLWVVHSLDVANDLKSDDMRKNLIEYVTNPSGFAEQDAKIRAKSDSPFETAVARFLVKEGYHIVQQWAVGSYRIDMVAIYEDNKIAIECDGELYHSGEDKVRADMERQTILERLGWRFIRIRGSEYYRNPEATMKRVVSELSNYDVYPEDTMKETEPQNNDLHNRVIASAAKILAVWEEKNDK